MLNAAYHLELQPPTLEEYLKLREISGLSPRTAEQGGPALENSWAWVTVRHQETRQAVGMGRVLGDGGWYFMIADIATDPEHQRKGIGSAVMESLLTEIKQKSPANPYVTLMADAPGVPLYRKFGFVETAPHSIGMRLD
ncbi:GNAT family N-acetyltransferase [Staphylococcus chromogenes]|nr:GNAT family N-acetyltransferase [Staphylococcus chromogenes]